MRLYPVVAAVMWCCALGVVRAEGQSLPRLSKAAEVRFSFALKNDMFSVRIVDDGQGFDVETRIRMNPDTQSEATP